MTHRQNSLQGKTIAVLGANGMFAADFLPRLAGKGAKLALADRVKGEREGIPIREVDITSAAAVKEFIAESKPVWIVNCAAYTAVDNAEKEYDAAFAVNAYGTAHLARAAKEFGVPLLHISTDYVFGHAFGAADKREPITEEREPRPCGIYGHSKYMGEELLMEILPKNFLLVRTSWLHGIAGPNFVDTMLRVGKEKGSLKVVDDQIGSPTWTGWLAEVLIHLLEGNQRGIFHASSRGNVSWFDFAREIFRQAGMVVEVLPQTTVELNRPAPRPAYSVLNVSKLERTLGEACISWQDCVKRHLEALGNAKSPLLERGTAAAGGKRLLGN